MILPPFPVGVVLVLLFTVPVTLSPYIPGLYLRLCNLDLEVICFLPLGLCEVSCLLVVT